MSMALIDELFNKYVALCEQDDVVGCGDLCRDQSDEVCKALYTLLVSDERTKDKLVKTLWYNYDTQQMRWK